MKNNAFTLARTIVVNDWYCCAGSGVFDNFGSMLEFAVVRLSIIIQQLYNTSFVQTVGELILQTRYAGHNCMNASVFALLLNTCLLHESMPLITFHWQSFYSDIVRLE